MLFLFENIKTKFLIWKNKSIFRAVVLGIIAAFCYSLMVFFAKFAAAGTTSAVIVFFRFTLGLFWVLLVLSYKRLQCKHFTLKTKRPGLQILRACSGFITVFTLYLAVKSAPIVEVNLLAMTYTLFIPVFNYLFLGVKTSNKNWLALFVGFIGIALILKPGGTFNLGLIWALIAGVAMAVSFIGAHELAKSDSVYTIIFYYFFIIFILSGISSIFDWRTPDRTTLLILVIMSIAGTAFQELITRALAYASPKIVSPLLYLSIMFSGFLGWIFWGYVPDWYFLLGMVLVVCGCIFSIIYAKKTLTPTL